MKKLLFVWVGMLGAGCAFASSPSASSPITSQSAAVQNNILTSPPISTEHETLINKIKDKLNSKSSNSNPKSAAQSEESKELSRENAPDYALAIFPFLGWKYPALDQDGWGRYYARMGFLLKGGKVHIMSDIVSLQRATYEAVEAGNEPENRVQLFASGLNYIFSDEGTTGAAVRLQNGLTNIHMSYDGVLKITRGSMCRYELALKHFKNDEHEITATYLPVGTIPVICGDVPAGMLIGLTKGPKEELLQRLYCDDHPKIASCAASSSVWTIPEFKRNA